MNTIDRDEMFKDIMNVRETSARSARGTLGYTMAEVMMAVGIITVLLGVAFIGLYQLRISLLQLEVDSTAKEIYIAAQNHLSLAKSQGMLDRLTTTAKGVGPASDTDDAYYFVVPTYQNATALEQMLPFGSIDETVRVGGSYIIRYHPSTGTIQDVFYAKPSGNWRGHTFSPDKEGVATVFSLADTKTEKHASDRRSFKTGGDTATIGWYGGEGLSDAATRYEPPTVTVDNGDKLTVTVTKPKDEAGSTDDGKMSLIIEGETSGAKMRVDEPSGDALKPADSFSVVLDDITQSNGRFVKVSTSLNPEYKSVDAEFIPGENLKLFAWTTNDGKLATVAKSAVVRTNSLFAKGDVVPEKRDDGSTEYVYKADITSLRHLSNLAYRVSEFALEKDGANVFKAKNDEGKLVTVKVSSIEATQKKNLSWTSFKENTAKESTAIYYGTGSNSGKEKFLPVQTNYKLTYNGEMHSITDVLINTNGPCGLFDELMVDYSSVTGLELVNFNVVSSDGVAGALAGSIGSKVTVDKVVARDYLAGENSAANGGASGAAESGETGEGEGTNSTTTSASTTSLISGSESVGGLVGTSAGVITNSAAAVYVSSTGAAGGLVGTATSGSITRSYTGGHTKNGRFEGTSEERFASNVASEGAAGGLVGISSASITNCYATCSVEGKTNVGGLIGQADGGTVSTSYVAGKVTNVGVGIVGAGTGEGSTGEGGNGVGGSETSLPTGAFLGLNNDATLIDCQYLKVVNQTLTPVGSGADNGVTIADDNTENYLRFAPTSSNAVPYDKTLIKRYKGSDNYTKYTFKTIQQLADIDDPASTEDSLATWVTTHYGDWPSYETNVVNVKS